jgi:hypothetical protein
LRFAKLDQTIAVSLEHDFALRDIVVLCTKKINLYKTLQMETKNRGVPYILSEKPTIGTIAMVVPVIVVVMAA